jgi:ABC-type antimicrobial peptide transport system permease subunit
MALGATSRGLLQTMTVEGLRPVLAGIACGILSAGGLSWALHASLAFPGSSDLLYGVPCWDPATFAGASFLLIGIAAAASAVPAARALRTDPISALRR